MALIGGPDGLKSYGQLWDLPGLRFRALGLGFARAPPSNLPEDLAKSFSTLALTMTI